MGIPKVWHLFGEDHLPFRLLQLSRMVERETQRLLMDQFGLSLAEWRLLAIASAIGPCSASEICTAGDIDRAEISRALRKLEPKGLLVRHQDPKHGKRLVISLTDKGIALHGRVVAERRQFFRTLMADIPTQDRTVIENAMTAMATKIGEMPAE